MIGRIIKLVLSLFYYIFTKVFDLVFFYRKDKKQGTIWYILMYHLIDSSGINNFTRHMKYLNKVAFPINPKQLEMEKTGNTYITVTFDDGFLRTFVNVLPVLKELNIPAVFFLPTDYFGMKPAWVTKDYEYLKDCSVISIKELLKIAIDDLVEIGSHSKKHIHLDGLDRIRQEDEIDGSKKNLEKLTGKKIEMFSAPFGSYDNNSIEIAKKSGYKWFFLNTPANFSETPNHFLVGRIDITPEDWALEYRLKILGAYQWQYIAHSLKRKIKKFI